MFCVFLRSFRSVLAKNPAILSSDGRERHFFFGSIVSKQLGRRAWKRGCLMV